MPDGSSSCSTGSPATLTSRISTQPASVSIGAATPAVRGIDLHGHHPPGSAPGTEAGGLRGQSVRAEPAPDNEQPRPGRATRGRWIGAARRLPSKCPTGRMRSPRGRAHPAVRVRRRRLDHRPVQLPRDPASEVLAWMAHALIAATRLGDTPDNASRDEPPPPAQHRNPRPPSGPPHAGRPTASPAGATHTGSPRRQARPAARGSQQGHARHRRRRPQRRHRPHKSSAASSTGT
jgi:hypothetical protein